MMLVKVTKIPSHLAWSFYSRLLVGSNKVRAYLFFIYDKDLLQDRVVEKPLELHLDFYFLLSRREQNEHFRFGVLVVTFYKLQIILFTILLLLNKSPPNFMANGRVI